MPEDLLYPSLPQISKIVNLTANTAATVDMLGGLVVLNGFELNVAPLGSTFFGAIYVAGAGTIAGSVTETVTANSIVMLAFGGGNIFSLKIASIPGLQALLDAKADTAALGTAAAADTGTTEGTIPVLSAGGKLASSLLPALSLTLTYDPLNAANTGYNSSTLITLDASQIDAIGDLMLTVADTWAGGVYTMQLVVNEYQLTHSTHGLVATAPDSSLPDAATWTYEAGFGGVPLSFTAVSRPKTTGQFAINSVTETAWQNLGDDATPDWQQMAKKSELETLEPADIGAETPAGAQAKVDAEAAARTAAVATLQPIIDPTPYADDTEAQANGIAYGELYRVDGGSLAWRGLDADALAYSTARSLPSAESLRLSHFLDDVKSTGVDLKLVTLGRSEFLARDSSTHHAVIGPDATITGTVGNVATGMDFDGGSANHFEMANPDQFAENKIWQLVVVATDALPNDAELISGANGDTGPVVRMESTRNVSFRVTEGPAGTTLLQRGSTYSNHSHGTFMMYGGQIGMDNIQPIIGIFPEKTSGTTATAVWNNETNWRLGEGLNGFNRLDGKISLAMAGRGELTREQIYKIAAAMVRHDVATINPPQWVGFVGDSMTLSVAGGAGTLETRPAVWANSASGWQGMFYDIAAQGGRTWDGASPNQSEFFDTMLARMAWVPDMPRTIVFWAGYNTPASTYSNADPAARYALADKYIAAAAQAAAAGVKTVHWSAIAGQGASVDANYVNGVNQFNDYYKAQLALLDGDHIFYDHRITFDAGEFDGFGIVNPAYFGSGDPIHLTAAGIAALMADFLTQYPNP